MGRKAPDIEAQLRRAILASPLTRYRIAKESGVSQASLSLFVHKKRTLGLTSAAKVAKVLGLELREAEGR